MAIGGGINWIPKLNKEPEVLGPEDFRFILSHDPYGRVQFNFSENSGYFTGKIDWGDGRAQTNFVDMYLVDGITYNYRDNKTSHIITVWGLKRGRVRFIDQKNLIEVVTPIPNLVGQIDFYRTFYGCTGLVNYPDDLFIYYNTGITNFNQCFYGSGIRKIPETLFDTCIDAISFNGTFNSLIRNTEITITQNLFSKNTKVEDFRACFFANSNLKGVAPPLWTRTNPKPNGSQCFSGCVSLQNYSAIDYFWKE